LADIGRLRGLRPRPCIPDRRSGRIRKRARVLQELGVDVKRRRGDELAVDLDEQDEPSASR
jgi:hypothetical protein